MKSRGQSKRVQAMIAKHDRLCHAHDEIDSIHDEICDLERRLEEIVRETKLKRSPKFKEAVRKATVSLGHAESDTLMLAEDLNEETDELFEKIPCL